MANIDADMVFFENPDLGRICLGGGPFEYALLCTRTGGFEVWSDITPGQGRCIAGEGYAGPSKIIIANATVFELTEGEWAQVQRENAGPA